jgi:tetratricopeptide (TPR) repeat protein
MEAKFIACTGDAAYVADLELAISDFADPLEPNQLLRLIQLHTARRVVNQRVSCYEDIHLETLVWLGCEAEALNYAHLRSNAAEKFTSLLTIYNALREKGQLKNSVLEEAWKAARDIRHDLIRAKVLSILAFTFAQAACQEQASIVFAEVRKIVQKVKDELRAVQEADPVSVNSNLADILATFAMSLAQAEYQDEARTVFAEARNLTRNIGINWWRVLSLIAIANSLAITKFKNEAYTAFLEAQYIAKKIDFGDIWMKSELVKTLVKMKRFPEARRMAVAISIKEPRAEVLTELATALIQEKRFDEVEEVAQLIDIPWMQIAVLSQFSTALAHAGYEVKARIAITQARNIIQTIKDNQIKAKAISYLAKALAQEGCKEEAKEIFYEARNILHQIENKKEQVNLLKQLGLTLSLADYKSEAKIFFNKAKYVLKFIEDNEHPEIDLSGIGDALAQAGFFPEVMEIFEVIQEPDLQVGVIIDLATALANTGEEKKAITAFADAEILSQAIEDNFQQAWQLNDLAAALIEAGYKDKAMVILEKAEVAVKKVESQASQHLVLSELIKNLAEAGNFPKATSLARAIRHPRAAATALGNVADALVQAGCLSEAKQLLKEIEDDEDRIEQLGWLVIPLVEAGNLFEAEKLAQEIEFPEQKARMLCKLATALAQAGNEDKASAVLLEVRSLVQRHLATERTGIKGVQINETLKLYPFVYSELATSLAEAKRFTQALSSYNLQEGLNELLCALGNWRATFEKVEPGLSVAVLREAIRIAGWMHPLWQEIYEVFPGRSTI